MKVNVYKNTKENQRILLANFEDFEKAEEFLKEHLEKENKNINDAKVENVSETHKKYFLGEENYTLIKHIEVVAAIIIKDGKLFTMQRGYGEFKDGWEFPGGKMEPGETMFQALERELGEELAIKTHAYELLKTIDFQYPNFHLTMHCIRTEILEGEPNLLEHEDAKWVTKEQIDDVAWLPADLEVVEKIKEIM